MSILATVVDAMIGGGGLSGIASAVVTMHYKAKELGIANAHQVKQWAYELRMARQNDRHEKFLAEQKLIISKQVGADGLRGKAIDAQAREPSSVFPWVNSIRSLNRIGLTWFLLFSTLVIHGCGHRQALAYATATEPQVILTAFIANAAASAIGFWFGDRIVAAKNR